MPPVEKWEPPPHVDVRKICRPGSAVEVSLVHDPRKISWIKAGVCDLVEIDNSGMYFLKCYLKSATDPEHDSAYALRLPLVGVNLAAVYYGCAVVDAWIAKDPQNFHVPPPGYDPARAEGSSSCSSCSPRHRVVPEELYLPPHDAALYEKVRGEQVEIRIMPRKG